MSLARVLSLVALLQSAPQESDSYAVEFLAPPPEAVLEVGGMDFLADGRLAVSTRRGQVWLIDNALAADPKAARFHLFAEGLHEGMGLKVMNGDIHVVQRTELSRLRDTDGDGVADQIDVVSNDWGASGNYHEFAFGLPQDAAGNCYVSLNVGFWDPQWWHGQSKAKSRGWVLRIAPDGTTKPIAMGFRSPNGLGSNKDGDIFLTDNQGDWMPACPLFHVREGCFYGHPASLNWTPEYRAQGEVASDTQPPTRTRTPAAVWFPYGLSRSTGGLTWDSSGGKFGPFAEQLIVAELTNGLLMRTQLERVQGEYQGAVFLLRKGVGSANRLVFASDGTLFVGLTNRGWGGEAPADGIARVRFTGKMPMEMQSVHLLDDGFDITFTKALAASSVHREQVSLTQYDYNYWWEYGSPETNVRSLIVSDVTVSSDRTHLIVHAPLVPGTVARLELSDMTAADGMPLLHPRFDYTINQLPHGARTQKQVANLVPPPLTREERNRGWLTLFDGSSLDCWNGNGWRTAEYTLALGDRSKLPIADGEGAMINDQRPAGQASDLVSRYEFGDCEAKILFAIPRGGNSGVYFMGRYEVQILDSFGKKAVTFGDCGGIYEGEPVFAGCAPLVNASREPCDMQKLEVVFQAPRFDAAGKKIANAKFISVKLNDQVVQANVEVSGPTRGGYEGEVPFGPLRLQGDHGPVVFDTVNVRAKPVETDEPGWQRVWNGVDLTGWQPVGATRWQVDHGTLVGRDGPGSLRSQRAAYRNFEWRAQVKVNHGGSAGLELRHTPSDDKPKSYFAVISSDSESPLRTGSVSAMPYLAILKNRLVPPDVWCKLHVTCEDVVEGVHIVVRVNDVVVTDVVDKKRLFASGPLLLTSTSSETVVSFRDIEVRERS